MSARPEAAAIEVVPTTHNLLDAQPFVADVTPANGNGNGAVHHEGDAPDARAALLATIADGVHNLIDRRAAEEFVVDPTPEAQADVEAGPAAETTPVQDSQKILLAALAANFSAVLARRQAEAATTPQVEINPDPARLQELNRQGYVGTLNANGDMAYRPPTAEEAQRRTDDAELRARLPELHQQRMSEVRVQRIYEGLETARLAEDAARQAEEDAALIGRYFPTDGSPRPGEEGYEFPPLASQLAFYSANPHIAPKGAKMAKAETAGQIDETVAAQLAGDMVVGDFAEFDVNKLLANNRAPIFVNPSRETEEILLQRWTTLEDEHGADVPGLANRYWRAMVALPGSGGSVLVMYERDDRVVPSDRKSSDPLGEPVADALPLPYGVNRQTLSRAVEVRLAQEQAVDEADEA